MVVVVVVVDTNVVDTIVVNAIASIQWNEPVGNSMLQAVSQSKSLGLRERSLQQVFKNL